MKSTKVAWMESQYLFPHHFQQQERYFQSYIEQRVRPIAAFSWGFHLLQLNPAGLHEGRIALAEAQGVMPDGCPFDLPSGGELPTPLQVAGGVSDQLVYLALPIYQSGCRQVDSGNDEQSGGRYVLRQLPVYDDCSDSPNQEVVETAELKFQLLLQGSGLGGYTALAVARIVEVTAEGTILLDKNFIAPSVSISAQPRLRCHLESVLGLLTQRAEAIAQRFNQDGKDKSPAAVVDFMLLQMLNRNQPQLEHLQRQAQLHPERLFSKLLSLAGELATFTTRARRSTTLVAYQHDDLQRCFDQIVTTIEQQLSVVLEQSALTLPVEQRQFGIYVSPMVDRGLLTQARFILAFKSAMPIQKLTNHIPDHIKVGSVETIRDLVNNQLSGISLAALPTAPREITYHAGFVYYQLDSQHELWPGLLKSAGFAFHVAGELPELELEFWAIRQGG